MRNVGPQVAALVASFSCILVFSSARAVEVRTFEFTYACKIKDVPKDVKQIDLWMPVPSDCQGQTVENVTIARPQGGQIRIDPVYGNRIFHKRFGGSSKGNAALGAELVFRVTRREVVVDAAKSLKHPKYIEPSEDLAVYLAPNALIPIDGRVADIARQLDLRKNKPLEAAHKVYDHLIDTMTYNWLAKGAGRGDVLWACDSHTGDCTDYHSTFLALCRATGIPADHQFGFPLPVDRDEGKNLHFHCWARFWAGETGWVPVDISEVDKHPELRQYNFGSLRVNQLKLSHGRDVTLVPSQQGPPLNIFVFPYVEVDGKPHESVKWTASFRDVADLEARR